MATVNEYKIINEELVLGHTIGAGAFGKVFIAKPTKHNIYARFSYPPRFVVKIIRKELCTPELVECANRELRAISRLDHPCVVKYIGMWVEAGPGSYKGSYCMAMHYCDGGDLNDFISACIKNKQPPSSEVVALVMACVLTALHYCHTHRVVHRDIKPANIFLFKKKDGSIKQALIGDFGLARPVNAQGPMVMTRVGTPCYCSPEIVNSELYSSKTDIFSAGATFYELMALERAFSKPEYTDSEVFNRILSYDPIPQLERKCKARHDPEYITLVSECLRKFEIQRPTAYCLVNRFTCIRSEVLRMHLPMYEIKGNLCPEFGEVAQRTYKRGHSAPRRSSAKPERMLPRRSLSRDAAANALLRGSCRPKCVPL